MTTLDPTITGIPPGNGARVAVAMSGGVDSSVAALLLREAGYDVIGVTMTLWSCHRSERAVKQTCCSTLDVEDARSVCARLGIPHVVADFRTEFRARVIENFVQEYAKARTPIPCIGCNQYFKFDRLWEFVRDEHGAEFLATGHYAQIVHPRAMSATESAGPANHAAATQPSQDDAAARPQMLRSRDPKKDQTYYLFVVTPAQLAHSLFPIGGLTKPQVREFAARYGLATADKPESFEICFVPDNDYAGFIEDFYPDAAGKPGAFVDADGATVGQHRGTHAYTIGQRRGINVSASERRYVTKIDPANAQVTLGAKEELLKTSLTANAVNWLIPAPSVGAPPLSAFAKIRAQAELAACTVRVQADQSICVEFAQPQLAITPGQAVVLYDGERVLGGGWIQ